MLRLPLFAAFCALLMGSAPLAKAEPPPVSASVSVGYGLNNSNGVPRTSDGLNMYGLSLGARAGYTWGNHVYAGASFSSHFGESKTLSGSEYSTYFGSPTVGAELPASARIWNVLIEGGYELRSGPLALRPYLGLGLARYSIALQHGQFVQNNGGKPAIAPGVFGTVDLFRHLFVGLDIRYTIVVPIGDSFSVEPLGGSPNAFEVAASLGTRF